MGEVKERVMHPKSQKLINRENLLQKRKSRNLSASTVATKDILPMSAQSPKR